MIQPGLLPPNAISVSDVNRYLHQLLESDPVLTDIWVRGEVSNLARPASGHIYFTLKDNQAALKAVIWKGSAMRLRLPLRDGMAVEAHGGITIYEPRGEYQIIVDAVRLAGEGALYQEFLRLKAQLDAEGLFDPVRKRPIPVLPQRIGVVTSPSGAALQDILNTLRQRFPLVEVYLAPSAVQGESAPDEIIRALHALAKIKPDVIIMARGGGSLEDLWAFNDENVVRAVAASPIPVISGVGHETDFTLTDFAADLRAPTPTGAAALAVPNARDLRDRLIETTHHLVSGLREKINLERNQLTSLSNTLQNLSPIWHIQNNRQRLDEFSLRLQRTMLHRLIIDRTSLSSLNVSLQSAYPQAILKRGFSLVSDRQGLPIHSVSALSEKDAIQVQMYDGNLDATIQKITTRKLTNILKAED